MTAVFTRSETTYASGGAELGAVRLAPDGGEVYGSVVLVPSIHGLSPYIETVAERLALHGYESLIVDIYSRAGEKPPLASGPEILQAVASLDDTGVATDIAAAVEHTARARGKEPAEVGLLGFCIGGMLVTRAATFVEAACVIDYYGMIRYGDAITGKPDPIEEVRALKAPLLGHFGDLDPWCPHRDVAELRDTLDEKSLVQEIYTYPGAGHAFDEAHRREVYRPAAAHDAWQRSLAFLGYHLGAGGP
jgi:carboxymethylenebutenolidase